MLGLGHVLGFKVDHRTGRDERDGVPWMGDDGARTGMLTWVVCGLQLSYPASPRSPWRGDNTHKNPGSGKTTGRVVGARGWGGEFTFNG